MILHGGDYCPEQWKFNFEIIESDIKKFKEANINCITLGMFSWSSLEPRENEYDTEWFKQVLDIILKNDMRFILGTPTAARPHWLAKKYPETSRINENGIRELGGNRHNHCMSNHLFRKKAKDVIEKQLDIAMHYPNLHSIHINNELNGYCYCNDCKNKFHEYLKDKYQTIEGLNKAWWNTFWSHNYTSFEEIDPPFIHGEQSNTSLLVNWEAFMTYMHNDYILFEKEVIGNHTSLPVTTNFCGTPFTTVIDYYKMAKTIDYISYDIYPNWNIEDNYKVAIRAKSDLLIQRSLDLDKDFYIMESTPGGTDWQSHTVLKSGKLHEASTFLQLQAGAKSCLYFQLKQSQASNEKFHGNVLDVNSNTNHRVYNYIKEFGRKLAILEQFETAKLKKEVAIYISWDSFNAMRHSSGPRNAGFNLEEFHLNVIEYFNNVNINCNYVYDKAKLSEFDTIILPHAYVLDNEFILELKSLKNKTIISFPLLAYVNTDDLLNLGPLPYKLTNEFGLEITEYTALTDEYNLTDEMYEYELLAEIIRPTTAKTIQTFDDELLNASITYNRHNSSDFYYIGSFPKKKSLMEIFDRILNQKFMEHDMCVRSKFILDDKEILTITNFGDSKVKISNCLWTSGLDKNYLGKYDFAILEVNND